MKVLDFGLAKLGEGAGQAGGAGGAGRDLLTQSPTITTPAMTAAGTILGTAAYMSPEQAKGKPADKRSDVWAFGCVLYEMLTGKRAFEGDDVSDTLAAILRGEPDWTALPADTSTALRVLLQRCLAKDRRQRIGDASAVRFVLDESPRLGASEAVPAIRPSRAARARTTAAVAALVVLTAAITYGVSVLTTRTSPAQRQIARFAINTPDSAVVPQPYAANYRLIAISPDGSHIAFSGANRSLMVRAVDQLEPTALASPDSGGFLGSPFFSPDGHWIAFFDRKSLKKVAIGGGAIATIGEARANPTAGTWSEDGTIIVADLVADQSGLWKISAATGEAVQLTKPNTARQEIAHLWPHFLPGGHGVLYTVVTGGYRADDNTEIALLDLRTGAQKTLIRGGSDGRYVPSGHIIYGRAGTLEAVAFDVKRFEVVGAPVPVVSQVSARLAGAYDFDVSSDGTLAYVSSNRLATVVRRRLVWADRHGGEEAVNAPVAGYMTLRLSPDGTRVAMDVNNGRKGDIWIWDLAREVMLRLTNDAEQNVVPLWTPDGRRVVYSSGPAGLGNLFWQSADGSGAAERLTQSSNGQYLSAVLPDNHAIFREELGADRDLMIVDLNGKRQVTPLLKTRFMELNGEVSPDGRWLAYESNDSGTFEVYVRPFPNVTESRHVISTGGGTKPVWARNGRELFYVSADGALMSVPVAAGSGWNAGKPVKVVGTGYFVGGGGNGSRQFDVSPDGRRFLMIKEEADVSSRRSASLVLVLNWLEELKQRVPAH